MLLNVPVSVPAHTALTETEWFGLGMTFKGHLLQSSCSERGHFHLEKVAQRSLQPDLVYLQIGGIHHLSVQTVPVFHHIHCKNLFPYIYLKPALLQFNTITPGSIARGPDKTSDPILLSWFIRPCVS